MIKRYGTEYNGLGSLFASILQVLNLSELGFSNAVIFSLYKPISENNKEKISALMQLYKRVYNAVGIVIAISGLIICPFIKLFISGSYPAEVNVYILFIFFLLNSSLSYIFFGYRSAILVANQRSDIESKIQIVSNLICYSFELCVLLFTKNYYLYITCMIIGTVINNVLLYTVTNKYYKSDGIPQVLSKEEKKALYSNVGALFGHQLDTVVINSIDNIVISMFLGLNLLTIYNNYYYILSAVLSILILIANSFTASVGNSIATRTIDINYNNFISFEYLIGNLNTICTAMLMVFYQDFMLLWLGKDFVLELDIVVMIVFMFYVRQTRRAVLLYKNACGMWKEDALKPYISAFCNLFLNIALTKLIGLRGVVLSTIVCMVFIEFPWEGKVLYSGYFKRTIHEYFAKQFSLLIQCIIITFVSYCFLSYFKCSTWSVFCLKFIIGGLLIILMTGMISDKENRKSVYVIIERIKTCLHKESKPSELL